MENTSRVRDGSKHALQTDVTFSSSQAFNSPVHPIRSKANLKGTSSPSILPVILTPAVLRPLAFRVFTKKHGLTLTSTALQLLASWIGKHCGLGWREDGLAEKVLDEAARSWKKGGGGLIVEGDGNGLRKILSGLEDSMSGGRVSHPSGLRSRAKIPFNGSEVNTDVLPSHEMPNGLERQDILGLSTLKVNDYEGNDEPRDPRQWLKVVGAFDHPSFTYNNAKKHFEPTLNSLSLLPDPSHKTLLFRNRYNLIHQRLLRNESFQTSSVASGRTPSFPRSSSTVTTQQAYKLTPIANLLGRTGSNHILLGLLTISPTGLLTLTDLTGSIVLDMRHARPAPEDGAWFTPGMIVLLDGMYEAEGSTTESELDGNIGVSGTVGGRFIAFSIGGPPCERRDITLGVNVTGANGNLSAGGGFGWVDFLGVGSERASGAIMRKLERDVLKQCQGDASTASRGRTVILGEVNLDSPKTLQALSKVLSLYATEPKEQTPMVFVLMGNFAHHAVMSGSRRNGSLEYKEHFDALASILSEYPTMLQNTSFIFVPGNNDPWASSFSAGAASMIPQASVPELFTSRIRRAFATANTEAEKTEKVTNGEAIWSTNPTRISLFGPAQEIVLFRDDISSRLRRNALRFKPMDESAVTGDDSARTDSELDNKVPGPDASDPEHSGVHTKGNSQCVDTAAEMAESQYPVIRAENHQESDTPINSQAARKLVKTILDQGYLSPFPPSIRPVLWDYADALHLYPLPTALVLMDMETSPFAISYQGCLVMNPGPLVNPSRRNMAQWMEYDPSTKQGISRTVTF